MGKIKTKNYLTIALPKGKLFAPTINYFRKIGLPVEGLTDDSRRLVFDYPGEQVRFIICRATDVPTYVEYGAADLGVVGKDTIEEQAKDICELVDLGFGYCRFVVAVPETAAQAGFSLSPQIETGAIRFSRPRVATKFPRVAKVFFAGKGLPVEIIKLSGNIELAPIVGLSEMIVDLVSTGRTLQENRLVEIEEIMPATARVVANRVSYRLKYQRLKQLIQKIKQLAQNEGEVCNA